MALTLESSTHESIIKAKRNGYRPTHRNKWLFLSNGILKAQELLLLEYYADQMDFDHRHKQYGTVDVNFREISQMFRNSSSTIRVWHSGLLEKKFIQSTSNKHLFLLANCERYIQPSKQFAGKAAEITTQEKDQPVEIILQNFEIVFQPTEKNVQPTEEKSFQQLKQSVSVPLGSFKGLSKVLSPTPSPASFPPHTKTNHEYQRLREEDGYTLLSTEDMEWLDKHHQQLPLDGLSANSQLVHQ